MSKLELNHVTKIYPSGFHLQPVSFTLQAGEFFTLLGPSGCGKTTLLKTVAGLIPPTSGDIVYGEKSLLSLPAEKRGFGMIFQQPHLFPHLTIEDNVAFGLRMRKVNKKVRIQQARETLQQVGLEGFGDRYPNELSGGQQQRVSLARALVIRPQILLMDEPFSALDPELKLEMQQLVKKVQLKYNLTILCVTHDQDEAFALSDRIAVMQQGQVLQIDQPHVMYSRPHSLEVAKFLGHSNFIPGKVVNGEFLSECKLTPFRVEGVEDGSYFWMIPPEDMKLSNESTTSATIKEIRQHKGVVELKVECLGQVFAVRTLVHQAFSYQKNQTVGIQFPKENIYLLP